MQPGRDLDATIASRIMGWTIDPIYRIYPGMRRKMLHCNEPPIGDDERRWSPSTEINAAQEALKKAQQRAL